MDALAERGDGFDVTASYGSVLLPDDATSATDALREADRRMYARKMDSDAPAQARSAGDSAVVVQLADHRPRG